jgi:2-polyprenyl-3-methyl-5-hydroxy-6-metoxy-1,4-benzoquinol methylase
LLLDDAGAEVRADKRGGLAFLPRAFYIVTALYKDQRKLAEAIRAGKRLGRNEHHVDLYQGTKKFFRPGYVVNLVGSWLRSLDGVASKLEAGARVADVGCGLGASTSDMAKAFPNSRFVGYDSHPESIEWARNDAASAGAAKNADFGVASAKGFDGKNFDLVTFFDCLHDMGDPVGAGRHVREALKPDGTWMVVEPLAGPTVESNLNPVGRIFYNASLHRCVPSSLAQEVAAGMGVQAGDSAILAAFRSAGFSTARKATDTHLNRIFWARP